MIVAGMTQKTANFGEDRAQFDVSVHVEIQLIWADLVESLCS